jgi:hypothetical protein
VWVVLTQQLVIMMERLLMMGLAILCFQIYLVMNVKMAVVYLYLGVVVVLVFIRTQVAVASVVVVVRSDS